MLKLIGDTYFLVCSQEKWAIKISLLEKLNLEKRSVLIPSYGSKRQIGDRKVEWEVIKVCYEGKTIFIGGKTYDDYCVDYEKECGRRPMDSEVFLDLDLFDYLIGVLS